MVDMKLELVAVPVSDVDRAKAFYTDKVGFTADHDHTVSDEIRFVQLTPPGSACSIAIGRGIVEGEPGGARGAGQARGRGQRHPGPRLGPVRLLRRPGRQQVGTSAAATARLRGLERA